MPITQFVTLSIVYADAEPQPDLHANPNGCAVRLVETVRRDKSRFELHGLADASFSRLAGLNERAANEGVVAWSALLTPEEDADLRARVAALVVPVVAGADMWGCDGVIYGLSIARGMSRLSFGWWVSPPAGWEAIGALAGHVLSLADATLARPAEPEGWLTRLWRR